MKATLDGRSLTRAKVVDIALHGAKVELDNTALTRTEAARDLIEQKVRAKEIVYGVTTGFGLNADCILEDEACALRLQRNLIVTHAVGVGQPMPCDVVRAMMAIRVNTLLGGHSGIRPVILKALAEMLNREVHPYVPEKGSVGASGDLAPLSHMAIVLLGEGDAYMGDYQAGGETVPARQALERLPDELFEGDDRVFHLSYKEGLALNNGTTQMTAYAALALHRMERLLKIADIAAAMAVEAMAGRSDAYLEKVHDLRPHPGQVSAAANMRKLMEGSTLVDVDFAYVPKNGGGWDWASPERQAAMPNFYQQFKPFHGGKAVKPQDSYTLRCAPQVHGAVRDAFHFVERVVQTELSAVTDNPLVFPEDADSQIVSAGNFHGMPISLAMSFLKAAIPTLASISERRLNRLIDPSTNDGLPAFLTKNEDGAKSGLMMVQYTAASLVNDLACRAHPASVYSIPTSANMEDHVSMGANEARHVYDMAKDLADVLALELLTAAQALDVRMKTLKGAYWDDGPWLRRMERQLDKQAFSQLESFRREAQGRDYRPGKGVAAAHRAIREAVAFLDEDRELSADLAAIQRLVQSGAVVEAVEAAVGPLET